MNSFLLAVPDRSGRGSTTTRKGEERDTEQVLTIDNNENNNNDNGTVPEETNIQEGDNETPNDDGGDVPEVPEVLVVDDPDEAAEIMNEWTEATAEHDEEWFQQHDGEQPPPPPPPPPQEEQGGVGDTTPGVETLEQIEVELEQDEVEAEIEDAAENQELDMEGFIDGTANEDLSDLEDEQQIIVEIEGEGAATDEETAMPTPPPQMITAPPPETASPTSLAMDPPPATASPTNAPVTVPPPDTASPTIHPPPPSKVDKTKVWTGEGVGNDDGTPPAPSPPTSWNAPSPLSPSPAVVSSSLPSCPGKVWCPLQQFYQDKHTNPLLVLGVFAFVPLFLLCCCRWYCIRRSNARRDERGDYRAVAARYGDMRYDNTFSDTMSDDGDYDEYDDDDFFNGHGDVEQDDSWGRSGKRTLEMSNLGDERNGGLSLEEMNG